jgi:hypothetical protein
MLRCNLQQNAQALAIAAERPMRSARAKFEASATSRPQLGRRQASCAIVQAAEPAPEPFYAMIIF